MRPQKKRFVKFNPTATYFKPQGIPMYNLEEVNLTVDEIEAVRLCDFLENSHEEAGKSMNVSRPTFGRIVHSARKKIASALIFGKAIKVEGGIYKMKESDFVFCKNCNFHWEKRNKQKECPKCSN